MTKKELKEQYKRLKVKPTCRDCNWCWRDADYRGQLLGDDPYKCHNASTYDGVTIVDADEVVSADMYAECFEGGAVNG